MPRFSGQFCKKCMREGGFFFSEVFFLFFEKFHQIHYCSFCDSIKDDLLYIFSEQKFVFNIILRSCGRPQSIYKSLIHKKEQIWKSS